MCRRGGGSKLGVLAGGAFMGYGSPAESVPGRVQPGHSNSCKKKRVKRGLGPFVGETRLLSCLWAPASGHSPRERSHTVAVPVVALLLCFSLAYLHSPKGGRSPLASSI